MSRIDKLVRDKIGDYSEGVSLPWEQNADMKGKQSLLWGGFTVAAAAGMVWSLSQREIWLAVLCILIFCVGLLGVLISGSRPHPVPVTSFTLSPELQDGSSAIPHESHEPSVRAQAPEGAEPVLFFISLIGVVSGVFSFIYFIFGAILLMTWLSGLPANVRTKDWIPVQARVLAASGEGCGRSMNGSSHRLAVTYRYQGDNYLASSSGSNARVPMLPPHTRSGTAYPYGAGWNSQVYQKDCGQDVKNWISYPIQQVYINPQQPNQAVVHRGVQWPQNTALVLGRGLGLLWFTLSLFSLIVGLPLTSVLFPWQVARGFIPFKRS